VQVQVAEVVELMMSKGTECMRPAPLGELPPTLFIDNAEALLNEPVRCSALSALPRGPAVRLCCALMASEGAGVQERDVPAARELQQRGGASEARGRGRGSALALCWLRLRARRSRIAHASLTWGS